VWPWWCVPNIDADAESTKGIGQQEQGNARSTFRLVLLFDPSRLNRWRWRLNLGWYLYRGWYLYHPRLKPLLPFILDRWEEGFPKLLLPFASCHIITIGVIGRGRISQMILRGNGFLGW
jgi:hypothetical protein